jgi:hypothetical protein
MSDTDPLVGCGTYQLCSLANIPAEEAGSMSVLVPQFPHQGLSGTSAWVELDSQTTTRPSSSSLSTRTAGTAAWNIGFHTRALNIHHDLVAISAPQHSQDFVLETVQSNISYFLVCAPSNATVVQINP